MITGGIDRVIEWLDLNGIETWSVSTCRDRAKCEYIFKSNDDAPVKDEQARMIQTLALSSNQNLYIFGKKKGTSNSANFMEMFTNVKAEPMTAPQVMSGINQDAVDSMIQNAIERERMAWERKELERDREEVRAMKKEYEEQTSSVVGLLIQKAAPIIQSIMGLQQPNVAVGALEHAVQAESIKPTTPSQEEETEDPFTDEEADRLQSLVEKWKSVDPDYITVIERIVSFAETGEPISVAGGLVKLNYQQIKEMIL